MKLYVLLLVASCLLENVLAATDSSSNDTVYISIGAMIVVLGAGGLFFWYRNKRHHDMNTIEVPPYQMSHSIPRSAPHPHQSSLSSSQGPPPPRSAPHPSSLSSSQGPPPPRSAPHPSSLSSSQGPPPHSTSIHQMERPPASHKSHNPPHGHPKSNPSQKQGHKSNPPPSHQSNPNEPSKPKPRARFAPDVVGGNGNGTKEPNERARQVTARVISELQSDSTLAHQLIPYSSLYFVRVLSKGAFGEVWLAQLENRQVAIKRILKDKQEDEKEIVCFAAEIKLMAMFQHPKIVEFVGVSWGNMKDLCAVTEYMAKGDLHMFLKKKNGQLNWKDHKIYLTEDVAEALGYLHALTPVVIHRDLKSKNILLDDSYRAKLSDFGISRKRSVEETMTAGVGTMYWTAPEVLMGRKYTERADIFSFGVCMAEIDTHEVPYADVRDTKGMKIKGMQIVKMVLKNKLRPTFSSDCPLIVRELAMECLAPEPDDRPDAIELLRRIHAIQRQL